MEVRYDIGRDEIVLNVSPDNKITGYTLVGGYDESTGKQVKVNRSILPPYFFDDFQMNRYNYYSSPEEVIYNKDYEGVQDQEMESAPQTPPTVPQEEYDSLKQELEDMKKKQEEMMELIQQLLGQKG